MTPTRLQRDDPDGLVRAFPSLQRKGCQTFADLEAAWDACGGGWSSGERLAALFVFHVMRREPFDVGRAMGVWDDEHRAAFIAWARNPWMY